MKFLILSLFPEAFNNLLGLVQTARSADLFSVEVVQLRDFGIGKHKKVDDPVFGGSDGMLIKPEVLEEAILSVKSKPGFEKSKVIVLSPKGKVWNQRLAEEWSRDKTPKILLCGRYAGFDQRFLDSMCDEEVSIGDFILNGGEVAALAVMESVVRLIPGVVGNQQSILEDSFSLSPTRLESPQYTRPSVWNEKQVPEILLSGHHEQIEQWKTASSISETLLKRKDILVPEDLVLLADLIKKKYILEALKSVYSEQDFNEIKKAMGLL
jgi:tRNA (guanine37-N1)-methyltransferase